MNAFHPNDLSSGKMPDADWSFLKKEAPSIPLRLILCLLFLILSVCPVLLFAYPLSGQAVLYGSAGICLVSLLAQALMLKRAPGLFAHGLTLFLVGTLLGSVLPAALCAVFLSSVTLFCYLGLFAPSPLLALLPLTAYGISCALCSDPFLAALSLFCMPAALLLLWSVRTVRSRTSVVCTVGFGVILSLAVTLVLYLLLNHHGLSAEGIHSLTEALRTALQSALASGWDTVETTLGTALGEQDLRAISETLVNTFFNFLPAILVLLAMALAFASDTAMIRILRGKKGSGSVTIPMMLFDMSLPSAVVFFLALLLSLMLNNPETALYATAAQNLLLILAPGMLMVAWMFFGALLFAKIPSCLGVLIYLALMFLIFSFAAYLLPLAAALGAGVTLYQQIRRALQKKRNS